LHPVNIEGPNMAFYEATASRVKSPARAPREGVGGARHADKKYLTRTEAWALIDAVKGTSSHWQRDQCMLILAYQHGLRVSELLRLKRTDIIRGTKDRPWEIRITRSKQYRKTPGQNAPLPEPEKTLVKMMSEGIEAYQRYMRVRPECHHIKDPLFPSERSRPMVRQTFNYIVYQAGIAAGLGHCNPHQLRHAVGYAGVNGDVALKVIGQYLGHKSTRSTEHYTELDERKFVEIQALLSRP